MALLAELAEREATGEKAAIYAELKRLGGVPMVALIFRHLATRPGVLEWAWRAIGPAWQSGLLQETAWRIAREASLVPIAPIPREALAALGIDASGIAQIRAACEAYNRANPENMLSVLCLLRLLEGQAAVEPRSARAWTPPLPPGPLAPMIDLQAMSGEVSALLDLVAAPGEPGAPRVVQSLYRHLAQRPAYLALAITLLRQRFDDGSIDTATRAIVARMNAAADGIAQSLEAPATPDPGAREVLTRFSGGVIPQMIVVGRLLEEALP
jgi:hypothetical protein